MGTTLITGGHTGLGFETAAKLAAKKQNLILAGRNSSAVEAAAERLRERFGVQVTTVRLDVSSLGSVRSAAAEIKRFIAAGTFNDLHALICNAGAQFRGPIEYSADGFELTFSTNYLGHFLLVNLLLDTLAQDGRIVFTASGTHDPDTIDGKMVGKAIAADAMALAHEGRQGKASAGGVLYATSKLCLLLFAYELSRRLAKHRSNLTSIAFDPGFIPETGLARTSPAFAVSLLRTNGMKWLLRKLGVTMGSISFSGDASARIATDPQFARASGQYLQSKDSTLVPAQSSKASYDEQTAAKLWNDSMALVKLQSNEMPKVIQ
ncbi:SDR family NAD(P)-dependent oxidoreductase [Caballeronia sp. LZ043]|uniref:SDR family NAD(P)-dependent oxidoreductase n=1 Tax=Caballeronia sp. LZ043 TaxID=3038569 RepID=UPI00285C8803|nr:SDR family NAD(P)-dependent oxidoreductase [Caballeronia sp. LZ043]MDR5822348.1 SDR family NAD(P)-dependent oxidoreductase [Caballeronia sp. LZ043]